MSQCSDVGLVVGDVSAQTDLTTCLSEMWKEYLLSGPGRSGFLVTFPYFLQAKFGPVKEDVKAANNQLET